MIGEPEYTDEMVEEAPPAGAASDTKTEAGGEPTADGPRTSAADQPHPFAGLFEVAIDGIATLAANFIRDRLSRIVSSSTASSDAPAPPEPAAAGPAAGPTVAAHHRSNGLLMAVAAAAITTTVLWYFHEKEKNDAV